MHNRSLVLLLFENSMDKRGLKFALMTIVHVNNLCRSIGYHSVLTNLGSRDSNLVFHLMKG